MTLRLTKIYISQEHGKLTISHHMKTGAAQIVDVEEYVPWVELTHVLSFFHLPQPYDETLP